MSCELKPEKRQCWHVQQSLIWQVNKDIEVAGVGINTINLLKPEQIWPSMAEDNFTNSYSPKKHSYFDYNFSEIYSQQDEWWCIMYVITDFDNMVWCQADRWQAIAISV